MLLRRERWSSSSRFLVLAKVMFDGAADDPGNGHVKTVGKFPDVGTQLRRQHDRQPWIATQPAFFSPAIPPISFSLDMASNKGRRGVINRLKERRDAFRLAPWTGHRHPA